MRTPRPRRERRTDVNEELVEAARERLVTAAQELSPGRERSLRLVAFRVRCAELLLRLAVECA